MDEYRDKAESMVEELTGDVSQLTQEINRYQNDFRFNNDQKDRQIDSLKTIIISLNSDLLSTSTDIEDQISAFQNEKRSLNQLLAEKDRDIRKLQLRADHLNVELDNLKKELNDAKIQLRNAERIASSRENKVQ